MRTPLSSLPLLILTLTLPLETLGAGMPRRDVLLTRPVTLPDTHVVTRVIRVTFPPGFRTPEHIHEGPGPRYVLTGRIRVEDQDGSRLYRQGEVFWETGEPMVAENAAPGETVLLIFEMAPAGAETPAKRRRKIVIRPQPQP